MQTFPRNSLCGSTAESGNGPLIPKLSFVQMSRLYNPCKQTKPPFPKKDKHKPISQYLFKEENFFCTADKSVCKRCCAHL